MRISPQVALLDQPRVIVVSHLRPRQLVTLHARTALPDGVWASSATFRADRHGRVDVARQAPLSGSYSGISPMGLRWAERRINARRGPLNGKATTTVSATVDKRPVASASMTQLLNAPGVTAHFERVRSSGFYGAYYAPPASVHHAPAIVLWGGSEGGLDTTSEAGLLASHGIPALALAYFDAPGLPCRLQDIPLEYFVKAIKWLRSQPQVDPHRVWIIGASRGTEAELLVAAHFPGLVHGLVAIAPTAYAFGSLPGKCPATGGVGGASAWTLDGKGIPKGVPLPIKQIKSDVLLLAGGDDAVWPSFVFAPRIMAKLPRTGATHRYLYYPNAGHLVFGVPYNSIPVAELAGGGTVASNSAAYIKDWPATISFISHH